MFSLKKHFFADNLLKHSSFLFVATIVASFLGYLYHLLMGRMLGPAAYGEIAALFTFIYLFATGVCVALQSSIVREIARLRAQKKQKELFSFISVFSKKVFLLAVIVLLVFVLFSPFVASFLHVSLLSVFATAVLVFFFLLIVVPWSLLQGNQQFSIYGFSNLLSALFKVVVAVGLVFFGFGVVGAISGISVGIILAFLFCVPFLKEFFSVFSLKNPKTNIRFFSWSVLLSFCLLMFLINIDIFLVKHFFSSVQAGQYSIASLLAKLIYFLAISFATVLLPMVSESVNEQKQRALLKQSLFYTVGFAVVLLFVFVFFSKLVVGIFFGAAFAPSAELLPLFGVAMALFSFSNLLVYFELALKRKRQVFVLAFFCLLETIGLWFFHSSLQQVLQVLVVVNALLFAVLVLNLFFKK